MGTFNASPLEGRLLGVGVTVVTDVEMTVGTPTVMVITVVEVSVAVPMFVLVVVVVVVVAAETTVKQTAAMMEAAENFMLRIELGGGERLLSGAEGLRW